MKKRIMIIACCLIIGTLGILFTGCGDKYADSPYVGTWGATTAEYAGVELSVEEVIGDFTITFNADGSCEATMSGETETGNWEPTDTGLLMTDDNDEMSFTESDGKLTVETQGVKFYFEKKQQ